MLMKSISHFSNDDFLVPADFCYGIYLDGFLLVLGLFEAGVGICVLSRLLALFKLNKRR